MSGGLTTSFTSVLSINELKRYLTDAIETQNMVTFYEISKELVKRNQPCVITDVLRIALGSGFEFSYSIAFANTARDVCYELNGKWNMKKIADVTQMIRTNNCC